MRKWILASAAVLAATCVQVQAADPAVGAKAPDFSLMDTNGNKHSLSDFKGKTVILEWVNHGCPYVKKHYDTGNMQTLQRRAAEKGAVWLSVATSAPGKQGHMSADEWNETNKEKDVNAAAVLLDENGEVGKAYGAKTTPHMFVIDKDGVLVYKGAIDNRATTDKEDVKGARNYVMAALDETQAGNSVAEPVTEPYGCSVKY